MKHMILAFTALFLAAQPASAKDDAHALRVLNYTLAENIEIAIVCQEGRCTPSTHVTQDTRITLPKATQHTLSYQDPFSKTPETCKLREGDTLTLHEGIYLSKTGIALTPPKRCHSAYAQYSILSAELYRLFKSQLTKKPSD